MTTCAECGAETYTRSAFCAADDGYECALRAELRDVKTKLNEARRLLIEQELRGVTPRKDSPGAKLRALRAAVLEAIHHLENNCPNTQALAVLREALL